MICEIETKHIKLYKVSYLLPPLQLWQVLLLVLLPARLHLFKKLIHTLSGRRRHSHALQILVELLQHLAQTHFSKAEPDFQLQLVI